MDGGYTVLYTLTDGFNVPPIELLAKLGSQGIRLADNSCLEHGYSLKVARKTFRVISLISKERWLL